MIDEKKLKSIIIELNNGFTITTKQHPLAQCKYNILVAYQKWSILQNLTSNPYLSFAMITVSQTEIAKFQIPPERSYLFLYKGHNYPLK